MIGLEREPHPPLELEGVHVLAWQLEPAHPVEQRELLRDDPMLAVSVELRSRRRSPGTRRAFVSSLRYKAHAAIMRRMARDEGRRSQLLRGVLDLCLLAVVEEEPAYGYEMTRRLRARGLSIVGEGSIYPLLGRLEREGLVDTYRAASNGGPPRKYYRLTRAGQRALAAGVAEWRAARDAVDSVLAPVESAVVS